MLATGCSGQERAAPSIEPSQMVNSQKMDDIYDVPSSENDITTEEESAITGKISDIKDFMFVVTDKDGVEYALSFEGDKPEGLSAVKEGDTVVQCLQSKKGRLKEVFPPSYADLPVWSVVPIQYSVPAAWDVPPNRQ